MINRVFALTYFIFLLPHYISVIGIQNNSGEGPLDRSSKGKSNYNARRTISTDQRNNYCEIYKQVQLGNIDRRNALNGLNISIGVLPYVVDQKTGKLDQNYIAIKILDEVARRGRFFYKDSFGVVAEPTGNETYTDTILSILDNYDVAVDYWLRSLERTILGISWAKVWYDSSTIMIMKKDDSVTGITMRAAFDPFATNVWVFIIFTIIISGLAYHAIDYITHCGNRKTRDRFGVNLFKSCLAFTGEVTYDPKSTPNRILIISIAFLCMILIAAYTANLASFLVNENKDMPIERFNDVISNDHRICVWKGAADVVALQFEYTEGRYVEKLSELEIYQGLANKECEVGLVNVDSHKEYVNKVEYNPNCDVKVVGFPVREGSSSFSLKSNVEHCSSIIRDVFDIFILEIIDDSTLERIKEEHYRVGAQNCDGSQVENKKLSLSDLGGIFIIHYSVIILALTLAVLSLKYPRLFVSGLHEISVVGRISDFIRGKTIGYLKKNSDERFQIEERVTDSDTEACCCSKPSSIDTIEDAFPSFIKLTPKDQEIKELYIEVLKTGTEMQATRSEMKTFKDEMQKSQAGMRAEMQKSQAGMQDEIQKSQAGMHAEMQKFQSELIKKLHEYFEVVKKSS